MERQAIIEALIRALDSDNPDSIEIGTPSKGGVLKVYGNFSRPEEFRARIDKAIELRGHAAGKLQPKVEE
jgi:hypothetical protein